MNNSQLLKGILEGCILAIIKKKETYGYEISLDLVEYGFGNVSEGTIYPLLLRLEKNNSIQAVFKKSSLGPKRKYYTLTSLGDQQLLEFKKNFSDLSNTVNKLFKDIGVD